MSDLLKVYTPELASGTFIDGEVALTGYYEPPNLPRFVADNPGQKLNIVAKLRTDRQTGQLCHAACLAHCLRCVYAELNTCSSPIIN